MGGLAGEAKKGSDTFLCLALSAGVPPRVGPPARGGQGSPETPPPRLPQSISSLFWQSTVMGLTFIGCLGKMQHIGRVGWPDKKWGPSCFWA